MVTFHDFLSSHRIGKVARGLKRTWTSRPPPTSIRAPGVAPVEPHRDRNSIRDLLGVEPDVTALLPPDDSSHGFDNMADALVISPALMEGYIRAAGRISREAVGDTSAQALTTTYQIPRVLSQMRHIDGTPFGTRRGMAVVHDFPADGEYVFKIGFYYSPTGPLFGLNQGKGTAGGSGGERHARRFAGRESRDDAREGWDEDSANQGEGGSAADGVIYFDVRWADS